MKIEYWPQRGSFNHSKTDRKFFVSFIDALDFVVNSHSGLGFPAFNKEDIYLYYYSYDSRVDNFLFALCVGRSYDENFIDIYHCPQLIGFLLFDPFEDYDIFDNKILYNSFYKKITPYDLRSFLLKHFDISDQNIKISGKYCCFSFNN